MLNTFANLYNSSLVLLTDFYQLTMAYGYWQAGMHDQEAVFHLSFRKIPFRGGYAICAGLATVIEYLNHFQFNEDDISYLASLKTDSGKAVFDLNFLAYLKTLRFSCDVDAIEEGNVVFPQEPLLRVKGPLLQCQLLETILLNIINFQTLVATKAARICYAAKGEPVLEFGLRRAQGFNGGLAASRAAYLGGCAATSNLLAGKLYGIPVKGTHAHSWIMCFPTEIEAFRQYANVLPENAVFLVDTYNSIEGIKNAITVAKELEQQGYRLGGIRLDSGDLAYLSIQARELLDAAGFKHAVIVASNDLDEHVIASLKEQGAMINIWGIGTKLVTAYEQPAFDGVYKLSAIRTIKNREWEYKVKLSEQTAKISTPGILNIRRFYNTHGKAIGDAVYDENLKIKPGCTIIDPTDILHQRYMPVDADYTELLKPIFRQGKLVYDAPSLIQSRARVAKELATFHDSILRFLNPHTYPVGLEENLYHLKTKLVLKAKGLDK